MQDDEAGRMSYAMAVAALTASRERDGDDPWRLAHAEVIVAERTPDGRTREVVRTVRADDIRRWRALFMHSTSTAEPDTRNVIARPMSRGARSRQRRRCSRRRATAARDGSGSDDGPSHGSRADLAEQLLGCRGARP